MAGFKRFLRRDSFSFVVLIAFLALAVLQSVSFAQEENEEGQVSREPFSPRPKRPDWPSAIIEVSSSLRMADDAFQGVHVSLPFKTDNPLFHSGQNLTDVEMRGLTLAIEQDPNRERGAIYLGRYTQDAPQVADVLLGVGSSVGAIYNIVDFNTFMTRQWEEGEKESTDFENAAQAPGSKARAYNRLLEGGFSINGDRRGIYSQPLLNPGKGMIDIMHEKFLLYVSGNGEITYFSMGTNNLTMADRVNRTYRIDEPNLARAYLEHAKELVATFKNGGRIRDVYEKGKKIPPATRVYFGPGENNDEREFVELGFTNGRNDPHARISEVFEKIASGEFEIMESGQSDRPFTGMSHFVTTNRRLYEAIIAAQEKKPFKIFGAFDDGQADQLGYGRIIQLGGGTVYRQLGGSLFGAKSFIADQMDFYVRMALGKDPSTGTDLILDDEEGPPNARDIWHDKTTWVTVRDIRTGRVWTYITSGSLNPSGHIENAEGQLFMRLETDSLLARGTIQSVYDVAKSEPQKNVPLFLAVIRKAAGRFLGRSGIEVPLASARSSEQAILDRRFEDLSQELRKVAQEESKLKKRLPPEEIERRIAVLENYLKWYRTNVPLSRLKDRTRVLKITGLWHLLWNPGRNDYLRRRAIENLLYRPELKDQSEKIEAWIQTSWKLLQLPGEAPPKWVPDTNVPPKHQKFFDLTAGSEEASKPARRAFMFDIDGNILHLPTKIILFSKTERDEFGNELERGISANEFALEEHNIGSSGKYADYFLKPGLDTGSFRFFAPSADGNYFLDAVVSAIEGRPTSEWQGPAWFDLVAALSDPKSAELVYLNTAREHQIDEIMEGFEYLRSEGYIRFLPQRENIFVVGAENGTANAKLLKIKDVLVDLNTRGKKEGIRYRFGMSEDSLSNYRLIQKGLQTALNRGRFKNVDISLFFTKPDDHRETPHRLNMKARSQGGTERLPWSPKVPPESNNSDGCSGAFGS